MSSIKKYLWRIDRYSVQAKLLFRITSLWIFFWHLFAVFDIESFVKMVYTVASAIISFKCISKRMEIGFLKNDSPAWISSWIAFLILYVVLLIIEIALLKIEVDRIHRHQFGDYLSFNLLTSILGGISKYKTTFSSTVSMEIYIYLEVALLVFR